MGTVINGFDILNVKPNSCPDCPPEMHPTTKKNGSSRTMETHIRTRSSFNFSAHG